MKFQQDITRPFVISAAGFWLERQRPRSRKTKPSK